MPRTPTSINAVYNSVEAKDVTVRVELDVSKDLGDELEILNRLSRTGNFSLGKEFFNSHLKAHIDDPAVFVQYAEMLLEQGDFKSLLLLDDKPIFWEYGNQQLQEPKSGIQRLELNWKLIRAVALCHSQHTLSSVWEGIDGAAKVVPSASATNSTELKIFSLAVRLRELTRTQTIFNLDERNWREWTDWQGLYRKLLSEDRIWDFRDVFFALSVSRSTKEALAELVGSASPSDQMLADWETGAPDESTNLALLEILSFMALNAETHPGVLPFAGECLRSAERIGNSIISNFPHAVHTRPFIQWIVAKALFDSSILDFEYLLDYPGQVSFYSGEEMPYYIPVRKENPEWQPRNLTAIARESLTMAVSSFKQMQDYQSEARCLKLLALGTKAPEGLLDDLAHLQKSKQLDKAGYLSTCLSRYLTCNDESSRASLLRDLESFGWWRDPANVIDPNAAAARDVLQHALSQNDANGATKSMEAALRYYEYLDASFAETINRNISPSSGAGLEAQGSRENINVDEQRKAEEEINEQMRLEA
ncbi:hypothetical protein INS49_005493 [Diaporthe citri]|uniref:uncharacterized protein n=1 Tax=Diaporthe citri TaxID=83186 RepID=UPI001C8081E0|nr:uncharacterized protein INS49_005493 [Diaporthe citri]KAG6353531.1 hypothetical protein INS49_005493 [Diaporthe citri]